MSEKKLNEGLSRTRRGLFSFFRASELDDEFYESLEEELILADVGMDTALRLTEELRKEVSREHLKTVAEARAFFRGKIAELLSRAEAPVTEDGKVNVIMVIGVNGAGKTTTLGKLAAYFKARGHKVRVAAADTFRAAASDQLEAWTERAGVAITRRDEGADPGAVLYDALAAARKEGADLILVDTAGRLHNKKNLMDELGKLFRILAKELPDAHREVLLVLDAATGLNARTQAEVFSASAPITGLVLTKLDGTAKGGVVIGISDTLSVPVKFIGVGEGIDDLLPFDAQAFAEALLPDGEPVSDAEP